MKPSSLGLLFAAVLLVFSRAGLAETVELRFGHFPNITHAQALVAHQLSRQGRGWFEERLGKDLKVSWYIYNAGPSAMEALASGALDVTYVGPNPALNAFARSRGRAVQILSGAAMGGAAFLVGQGVNAVKPADFRGRKLASPQLGNTQDIALRAWLKAGGLNITQQGGDAFIIPTANPDQLDLLKRGEVDGVWTVEPWVSRLELEAGGRVLVDDHNSITTVLSGSPKFIRESPDLVRKIVLAHRELTEWIVKNPAEAKELVRREIKEETGKEIPQTLLDRAWPRINFSDQVDRTIMEKSIVDARLAGFLPQDVSFEALLNTSW